jgi:hypothetical protein
VGWEGLRRPSRGWLGLGAVLAGLGDFERWGSISSFWEALGKLIDKIGE